MYNHKLQEPKVLSSICLFCQKYKSIQDTMPLNREKQKMISEIYCLDKQLFGILLQLKIKLYIDFLSVENSIKQLS